MLQSVKNLHNLASVNRWAATAPNGENMHHPGWMHDRGA